MRLRYTPKALAELDDILTYIAERSCQGAQSVHQRIKTIADLLAEHPHAGQMTSESRLRCIAAVPYPYLVFYEVTGEEVIIIAVRHAARDPSTMPGRT